MTPVFDFYCAVLVFGGALVLLIGLLCGIPYSNAITGNAGEEKERAWRLAHSSLAMGGTTLLAVGGVLPWLEGAPWERGLVAWGFVISGVALSLAIPYGAWKGERGLGSGESLDHRLVSSGYMVGALTSLAGAIALVYLALLKL